MLLAIDPGLRNIGCALFTEGSGTLVKAALVPGAPKILEGAAAWRAAAESVSRWARVVPGTIAFERPGSYRADGPKRTLDLQNLVAVCAWTCGLLGRAADLKEYFPHEWEGGLRRPDPWRENEDPVVARVKSRLSPEELAAVELPAPSLRHNVWDAVGIGLKALGRFEPAKIFSRG